MDNTQKFELADASAEDTKAFTEGIDALLAKLSLGISLVINKKGISVKNDDGKVENVFVDQPTLLIQKKTLITPEVGTVKDAEVIEGSVPSTNPEVNPAI